MKLTYEQTFNHDKKHTFSNVVTINEIFTKLLTDKTLEVSQIIIDNENNNVYMHNNGGDFIFEGIPAHWVGYAEERKQALSI